MTERVPTAEEAAKATRRMPRVNALPFDEHVVVGAVGCLIAMRFTGPEVLPLQRRREINNAFSDTIIPATVTKLYERGEGQPPRAIQVTEERDGRTIFMVWSSVIAHPGTDPQRVYVAQARGDGWVVRFDEVTIRVQRFRFHVGNPHNKEEIK